MDNVRTWFPLTGVTPAREQRSQAATRAAAPIDPLTGPRIALAGRVVTMNDAFEIHPEAVVYVDKGTIVAVQPRAQMPPGEFAGTPVLETGGTIFPGLIELHNHLSYNALPLWSPVPRRFKHRGEWPNHKDYRPLVSGPMTVIGRYQDANGRYPLLAPLIRYVECKCLLGGVTSTQGVKLASNAGIQRFYRGIVRNVEQTDEPGLPEAQGRIPDLDAKDARNFLSRLQKEDSCFLLHLSEGVTDPANPLSAARKHFLALEVAPGQWALRKVFAGIHSTGLLPQDFDVLARYGCSMVWSPFSNLLLYGGTARVDAARRSGVAIGLGSDWSPTGSKNLLGEMKVAWLHSQAELNGLFSARDIVAMATRNAARILKWDKLVGSIEPGRRADVLVIAGADGDPYEALIRAKEQDIRLLIINGVPRYAVLGMAERWMPDPEFIRVAGERRALFLDQQSGDPDVADISLKTATLRLRKALREIAKLARQMEQPPRRRPPLDTRSGPVWSLALDEISPSGVEMAPRLPYADPSDFTGPERAPRVSAKTAPLSAILKPIQLDALTVADDATFLERVAQQPNVPATIREALAGLY